MRYRLDLGLIIDQETGEILEDVQIRNRLNKQHEEIIELREAMKRLMADMMTGGIR